MWRELSKLSPKSEIQVTTPKSPLGQEVDFKTETYAMVVLLKRCSVITSISIMKDTSSRHAAPNPELYVRRPRTLVPSLRPKPKKAQTVQHTKSQ